MLGDDCSADSRNAIAVKRITLRRDSYTRELVNGKGRSLNYITLGLKNANNAVQTCPTSPSIESIPHSYLGWGGGGGRGGGGGGRGGGGEEDGDEGEERRGRRRRGRGRR